MGEHVIEARCNPTYTYGEPNEVVRGALGSLDDSINSLMLRRNSISSFSEPLRTNFFENQIMSWGTWNTLRVVKDLGSVIVPHIRDLCCDDYDVKLLLAKVYADKYPDSEINALNVPDYIDSCPGLIFEILSNSITFELLEYIAEKEAELKDKVIEYKQRNSQGRKKLSETIKDELLSWGVARDKLNRFVSHGFDILVIDLVKLLPSEVIEEFSPNMKAFIFWSSLMQIDQYRENVLLDDLTKPNQGIFFNYLLSQEKINAWLSLYESGDLPEMQTRIVTLESLWKELNDLGITLPDNFRFGKYLEQS